MGKCISSIEEMRIDVRDEQMTKVYVLVRAEGDCPLGVQGWHHKTFPARLSAITIMQEHFADYLLWPLAAPDG